MTKPAWLLSLDVREPWQRQSADGIHTASRAGRWIALHGRLYDTDALADELGGALRSSSPADLVLDAFERWGWDAVARLRGVFVVALGDANRREVIVARDPLGSHPLFVTRSADRWLFGESTHELRLQPGVPGDLNRVALADHLCHRWPSSSDTFFSAIERIPPGHWVRLTPGGKQTTRYWNPAPPGQAIRWTGDDVLEHFASAFDHAIDRCLQSGPSGIFLSGGLDSISVAAGAADRARARGDRTPRALSLAMPDPDCDERETQSGVAGALGLPFHLVEFSDAVGPRGVVAMGIELGQSLSSPLLNFWAPAYLTLAAAGARDEWLSVSPYLSADLLARGDLRGWWQFFRAFQRSYRHSLWGHAKLCTWTFGFRPLASRTLARAMGAAWQRRREAKVTVNDPAWIAPDTALKALQRARAGQTVETADPAQGFYVREMHGGLDHPLTSWELEEQYEFGKRAGQTFLHPYWDADLVDILYRTPPALLMHGGRAKGLVRGPLARRFPSVGLERQKKVPGTGFYRTLVGTHLPNAAAEIGDCRTLADLGIITGTAAREYQSPSFGTATNRWDVINLEAWVRANS
jgi:hypothetical protein